MLVIHPHVRAELGGGGSGRIGGFGSGVMEILSEEGIVMPVKRVGLPDRFLPHSPQKLLRQETGLDEEGIKRTVKHWLDIG